MISAAQFAQVVHDSDGKIAESRKRAIETLDDERRRLMYQTTRTQALVSKTHAWISQRKKQKESEGGTE